jgi:hypothetical protein
MQEVSEQSSRDLFFATIVTFIPMTIAWDTPKSSELHY